MQLSPIARRGAALALLVLLPILGALGPEPLQDPQDPTAPFPRSGAYMGMDGCIVCHEEQQLLIQQGVHRDVIRAGLRDCETCHGPGAAHGEDLDMEPALITHPPSLSPEAQFRFCGACHREQLDGHRGDPLGFLQAGKGCTDCHLVHEEVPEPALGGLVLHNRRDTLARAKPVGAQACLQCHPLRNELLERSHHGHMAAANPRGCETCHGAGSLHVESGGVARLITRPDRARDGMQTCRSCHEQVDPVEFHWVGGHKALLTPDATCTTCHGVHRAIVGQPVQEQIQGPAGTTRIEPDFLVALGLEGPAPGALPQVSFSQMSQSQPTNQVCVRCHEPAFDILPGTVHETLGMVSTPLDLGCASCHEGAWDHALASGRKDLVESMHGTSAAYQLASCGKCHGDEEALRHVRVGAHNRSEVSCLSCHSPAAPRGRVLQDAEQKCQSCHQNVAAQFRQPNRHPVPEGHMACSDCHDPHGARRRIRDLELRQGRCVTCHREYRGPYVYAHNASRVDGCVICHSPHGSSNNRLLWQATTQQNCLQCHGDFPLTHDVASGAVLFNCLNCHTEIHGSNHSRFLFR